MVQPARGVITSEGRHHKKKEAWEPLSLAEVRAQALHLYRPGRRHPRRGNLKIRVKLRTSLPRHRCRHRCLLPYAPVSGSARRALGDFAETGNGIQMRRGLRNYVRRGYGGAAVASRRHGGTAATAGTFWNTLSDIASGELDPSVSPLDTALQLAQSAEEVMDAVVESVRQVDGTQDAEVERIAIRDALSDLLSRHPDAELSELGVDERTYAIERFTAITIFRRFELDVGLAIHQNAPNAATVLARLGVVRNYIDEAVAASFRAIGADNHALSGERVEEIVLEALNETFEVFEAYTR